MNKKIIRWSILSLVFHILIFPRTAKAVIPPDFIFNIGTQIAQFFSIITIIFTAIFGTLFQFFRARYYALKHRRIVLAAVVLSIIVLSSASSYFYAIYAQKVEYQKWLEESLSHSDAQNSNPSNDARTDSKNPDLADEAAAPAVGIGTISKEDNFFSKNENKNIVATNQEFKDVTESGRNDYMVLDARENIEYENGFFPDSEHIRFADLRAGSWSELPKDKFIYVICWSGIRGKEVAEFLRTKKIVSSYLENGANGWVEFGGKWTGSIKFVEKYTDAKYQKVFSTSEIRSIGKDNVVLVDTREPDRFLKGHISGSISIPIMYTPTIDIEQAFSQVPSGSKVITVCDGYVNCFDAKITGVELERRGHQFLGRYNKPWEYEK